MGDDIEIWKPPFPVIPLKWAGAAFDETFEVISTNNRKIKQKDYIPKGLLPVIDQGATLIGGYTNKLANKIETEKPIIVFGDHTKCFKHINFPFVPGADGTKVLLPRGEIESKYLYFLCHILQLPDRGYSRHFSFLKKSVFPIAPLNEQKRIVDKIEQLFSNLDEGEALLKQIQKQLGTYRQSVLKAAVTGELTKEWREANKHRLEPSEVLLKRILQTRRDAWQGKGTYKEPKQPETKKLPNLPEGWIWSSLSQALLKIEAGKNFKCRETPPEDNEIGVVKISAVTWGVFNEKESKTINNKSQHNDKLLIREGDFLFSRANTLQLVGASVIVRNIKKKLLISDKVLRFVFADRKISEWCNIFLKSPTGRKQIELLATGNQLSMRNISQESIRKICVPLCSHEELEEIVNSVATKFSQIDVLESWCASELARSSALRQSILKDAFSGKLVPQDPNDEPASELLKRIQAEKSKAAVKAPAKRGRKKKVTA